MKRLLALFTAAIVLSISSLYAQNVTKTFNLGNFNGIDAGFVHKIYITKGASNKIEVTCPERFVEYLDYKVVNGILHLNIDQSGKKWKFFSKNGLNTKDGEEIVVRVQMKEIRSIDLSGASELTATGTYSTNGNFDLDLSGASHINETLNVNAATFTYDLSGASDGCVKGDFNKIAGEVSGASEFDLIANSKTSLNITASGSSDLNFKGKANSVILGCSGASNISFKGEGSIQSVKIGCSGASEVDLEGATNSIEIQCSGASNVDAENMIAENAKAIASGSSHIKVFGNNTLELSTSGAASIKYYGEARNLKIDEPSISRGK